MGDAKEYREELLDKMKNMSDTEKIVQLGFEMCILIMRADWCKSLMDELQKREKIHNRQNG